MSQSIAKSKRTPVEDLDPEVLAFREQFEDRSTLDQIIHQGAQQMLQAAIDSEVEAFIERHGDRRDEQGRFWIEDLKSKSFMIYKMKRWSKDEPVEVFNPKDKRLLFVAPEPDEQADSSDGEVVNEPDDEPGRYVAVPAMAGG